MGFIILPADTVQALCNGLTWGFELLSFIYGLIDLEKLWCFFFYNKLSFFKPNITNTGMGEGGEQWSEGFNMHSCLHV